MSYLMSFNFARSNRNGPQSNQRFGNAPKLTSSSLVKTRIQDNQAHSNGGQVQLLRQSVNQSVTSASNSQKHTEESRASQINKMNSSASLISMDEVLEDLRVLEKQQLESQRQLESIKQAKTYKLEQKALCAKKLSSVKFANGQSKEKMERARNVLSECSHILNDSRRSGDSFYDELKHLDSRVKQVIQSLRSLQAKRRQVDYNMMTVRQKQIRVTRSKENLEKRFYDVINRRDDIIEKEKYLAKSIQEGYATTKVIADESSGLRKLLTELEQVLTDAQQKSIASKSKLDSLSLETVDEQRRHSDKVILAKDDLLRTQQLHDDIWNQVQVLGDEIRKKSTESMDIWNRFYVMQAKYIDIPRSRRIIVESLAEEKGKLETLEHRLRADEVVLSNFDEAANDLNLELIANNEKLLEIVLATKAVNEDAEDAKRQELLRNDIKSSVLVEVERKRTELLSDNSACSQLQQRYQQVCSSSHGRRVLMEKSTSDQEKLNQELISEIQQQTLLLEELKQSLKNDQVYMATKDDELSIEVKRKQILVDELQLQQSAFDSLPDIDNDIEVMNVMQQVDDEFQEMQRQIKERRKVHPCLESLQLSHDPRLSLEENITLSLRDLQSACNFKVMSVEKEELTKRSVRKEIGTCNYDDTNARRVRGKYTSDSPSIKQKLSFSTHPEELHKSLTEETSGSSKEDDDESCDKTIFPRVASAHEGRRHLSQHIAADKSRVTVKDISQKTSKAITSKAILFPDTTKSRSSKVQSISNLEVKRHTAKVAEPSKVVEYKVDPDAATIFSRFSMANPTCNGNDTISSKMQGVGTPVCFKEVSEKSSKALSSKAAQDAAGTIPRSSTYKVKPTRNAKDATYDGGDKTKNIDSCDMKEFSDKKSKAFSNAASSETAASNAISSNGDIKGHPTVKCIVEPHVRERDELGRKGDKHLSHKDHLSQRSQSADTLKNQKNALSVINRNVLPKFDIFGSEDDEMCNFLRTKNEPMKKHIKEDLFRIDPNQVLAPTKTAHGQYTQSGLASTSRLTESSAADTAARRRKKNTSTGKGKSRNDFSTDLGFM